MQTIEENAVKGETMEVILAKSAGFCFGVQKAVDTVYAEVEKATDTVYTYGPIIHNEEVVHDLEEKGVVVLEGPEDLEKVSHGTVIIRSHGVGPDVYDIIRKRGLTLVDATCPFVKKIHNLARKYTEEGYDIVIVGDPKHPEVVGIRGWCEEGHVHIISEKEDIDALEPLKTRKFCVLAQTTFQRKKFEDFVEIFKENSYSYNVVNTICNATAERQEEAAEIAACVDAMIVIGGKSSSNSRKLYDICKGECEKTFFIQTLQDLDFFGDASTRKVGITAGASTPKNIIKEVQNYVRIKF